MPFTTTNTFAKSKQKTPTTFGLTECTQKAECFGLDDQNWLRKRRSGLLIHRLPTGAPNAPLHSYDVAVNAAACGPSFGEGIVLPKTIYSPWTLAWRTLKPSTCPPVTTATVPVKNTRAI